MVSSEHFQNLLTDLNAQYQAGMSPQHIHKAAVYFELLSKWSKAYNLTAITDPKELVIRHWFDSLSIAGHLHGQRVLDVGTGAGLPGIPLATKYTDKHFCLLDSIQKRQIFLQQVIHKMELDNVTLHCGRVEHYHDEVKFDCIISRAFKSLPEFVDVTKHLLAPGGAFYAMKGSPDSSELAKIDNNFVVSDIMPLSTVESDKQRHLVIVKAKQAN